MILGKFVKQPAEREAYAIEYEDDFATGDTILTTPAVVLSQVGSAADPTPLALDATGITATRATMWLSGGTNGLTYKVTVTTTTSSGRILQDEFILKIKDF